MWLLLKVVAKRKSDHTAKIWLTTSYPKLTKSLIQSWLYKVLQLLEIFLQNPSFYILNHQGQIRGSDGKA